MHPRVALLLSLLVPACATPHDDDDVMLRDGGTTELGFDELVDPIVDPIVDEPGSDVVAALFLEHVELLEGEVMFEGNVVPNPAYPLCPACGRVLDLSAHTVVVEVALARGHAFLGLEIGVDQAHVRPLEVTVPSGGLWAIYTLSSPVELDPRTRVFVRGLSKDKPVDLPILD